MEKRLPINQSCLDKRPSSQPSTEKDGIFPEYSPLCSNLSKDGCHMKSRDELPMTRSRIAANTSVALTRTDGWSVEGADSGLE
jgi:hypothetical protein